jgi:hypothetical protein
MIAPRAEILDMKVANRNDRRRIGCAMAHRRPKLHPAIERAPQKHERALSHSFVLQLQITLDERDLGSEPGFKVARGRPDVHWAADDSVT